MLLFWGSVIDWATSRRSTITTPAREDVATPRRTDAGTTRRG